MSSSLIDLSQIRLEAKPAPVLRQLRMLLMTIVIMGFTTSVSAGELFSDNFEDGTLNKWTVVNGTWEVVTEGSNHIAHPATGDTYGRRMISVTPVSGSIILTARTKGNSPTDGQSDCTLGFYSNADASSFYYVMFGGSYTTAYDYSIGQFYGGGAHMLNYRNVETQPNNIWHNIKVKLEDSRIDVKVWRDGTSEPTSWQLSWTTAIPYGNYLVLGSVDGTDNEEFWFDDVAATSVDASAANILVYDTYDGGTGSGMGDFDSTLPSVLQTHGHSVIVTQRTITPQITATLLANYDELWIISADCDATGCFIQAEIDAINSFRQQGRGLLLASEHECYCSDANQIANSLGVSFYGTADNGYGAITPSFDPHPLFSGVTSIFGDHSEALMSATYPADVVATYAGHNLIAVLDDGQGRVVFDASWFRCQDSYMSYGDGHQYARNIADWLKGGNQPPVAVIDISPNPTANYQGNKLQIVYQGYGASHDIVQFDGSQSSAYDGKTITDYIWKFDGVVYSYSQSFSRSDLLPGTYVVTLTITDNGGQSSVPVEQLLEVIDGLVFRPPFGGDFILDAKMELDTISYWGTEDGIKNEPYRNGNTGFIGAYSEVTHTLEGCNRSALAGAGHYAVFETPPDGQVRVTAEILTQGGKSTDLFGGAYTKWWLGHIWHRLPPAENWVEPQDPWNWKWTLESSDWGYFDHPLDWGLLEDQFVSYLLKLIPGWGWIADLFLEGLETLVDYLNIDDMVIACLTTTGYERQVLTYTLPIYAEYNAVGYFVETNAYAFWVLSSGKAERNALVRYIAIQESGSRAAAGLTVCGLSPIDLIVVDPNGDTLSKSGSSIPNSKYLESDIDRDGHIDDYARIDSAVYGDYLITVIPDSTADTVKKTYSLLVASEDTTFYLAQDVNLSEIPGTPYSFRFHPSCGDASGDATVNISDAVYLIAYIFSEGPAPNPLAAGDADCSGAVNISDVVYLVAYIFSGGPQPCAACK